MAFEIRTSQLRRLCFLVTADQIAPSLRLCVWFSKRRNRMFDRDTNLGVLWTLSREYHRIPFLTKLLVAAKKKRRTEYNTKPNHWKNEYWLSDFSCTFFGGFTPEQLALSNFNSACRFHLQVMFVKQLSVKFIGRFLVITIYIDHRRWNVLHDLRHFWFVECV